MTLGNMRANGVRMERRRDLIRAKLLARPKLSNGGRDAGFSFGACGCLGSLRFNTRRANDTGAGRPRAVVSCRRISRLRCMGRLGERATETPLAALPAGPARTRNIILCKTFNLRFHSKMCAVGTL
jgi:hypothetical protein